MTHITKRKKNPSAPPLTRSIEPPTGAVNRRGYIQPHQHRTSITDDYTQSVRRGRKKKHCPNKSQGPTAAAGGNHLSSDLEGDTAEAHNQRWQKRNLRPTPSPIARRSRILRLTPSPTTSSQQSPDSEPRRSSHIQAKEKSQRYRPMNTLSTHSKRGDVPYRMET